MVAALSCALAMTYPLLWCSASCVAPEASGVNVWADGPCAESASGVAGIWWTAPFCGLHRLVDGFEFGREVGAQVERRRRQPQTPLTRCCGRLLAGALFLRVAGVAAVA